MNIAIVFWRVKSNHTTDLATKSIVSTSRGLHIERSAHREVCTYVATVATQVIKSWGECESRNKCLQSQYTTTVHRFMKGVHHLHSYTQPTSLKHKVTCSGTVINSSRRTQHSQLRSTCHNVYSYHACYGCCPWDGTRSLVQLLVFITSAVVAPSLINNLGSTNEITGNWNHTPNYLDWPSTGNYRVCVCVEEPRQ